MMDLVKLERWAIGYVTKEELGDKPAACARCTMLLARQQRCSIIGPDVVIADVEKDGKSYVPVCSQQEPGAPMDMPDDMIHYASALLGSAKADLIGLEWAEGSGDNCGGRNGGAVCTKHYESVTAETGNCRPLQAVVNAGDCCAAHNGPSLPWREAQVLLINKDLEGE